MYHQPNVFFSFHLWQVRLTDVERKIICDRLSNAAMPVLSSHLADLQIIINFLSALSSYDPDTSLAEYIAATFSKSEPNYLTGTIKLKHLTSVWLTIKYIETHQLMTRQQVRCCSLINRDNKPLYQNTWPTI